MNQVKVLALLLALVQQQVSAISAPATLYNQPGLEGARKAIYGLDRVGACRTLPDFNDQTKSVDLAAGYCVRIFGGGCDDRSWGIMDLGPNSGERLDISSYGFTGANGISAIQRVSCPIDDNVPILYTGVGQSGQSQPIYGLDKPGDCVSLPFFNDMTRSIHVPAGKCLQLFGGGCGDNNWPHVEVSANTKVNNDLAPAGYTGPGGLSTIKRIECRAEPAGTLYSDTNQNGAPRPLNELQKVGDCVTLPDFNDRTKSLSVQPGRCIRLFGGGCNDFNHIVLEVDSKSTENDNIGPSGFVGGEGVSAAALIECPDAPAPAPAPAPVPDPGLGDLSGFVVPPPPKKGWRLFPTKNYRSTQWKYMDAIPEGYCVDVSNSYQSLQVAPDVCPTLQENDCETSISNPGHVATGTGPQLWFPDFDKSGFRTARSSIKFMPCSGSTEGSPSFFDPYFQG